jgi:hypothetical protein
MLSSSKTSKTLVVPGPSRPVTDAVLLTREKDKAQPLRGNWGNHRRLVLHRDKRRAKQVERAGQFPMLGIEYQFKRIGVNR